MTVGRTAASTAYRKVDLKVARSFARWVQSKVVTKVVWSDTWKVVSVVAW